MTIWGAVVLSSLLVYSWKLIGAYVPQRFMEHPMIARMASLLTVALMAGLIAVQGLTTGGQVHLDARIPALLVAGLLTWRRVPFILMVAVAAAVAACLRAFWGWS